MKKYLYGLIVSLIISGIIGISYAQSGPGSGSSGLISAPPGGDLVTDITPQLGGDLDLNGFNFDFPTTPNISDVLDEDLMGSDSATKLATQQSIKAYVDSAGGAGAPTSATYITQTPNVTLSAEQALNALATGIMRVATTTGVVTALTDSAGIAANISDESGTGVMAFTISPVITTPQINDTSSDHQYIIAVNELVADRTITFPLLTGNDDFVFEDHAQILTNKTIATASNTITVVEADISDIGTLIAMVADNLSVFAATTSAQLAGVLDNETGTLLSVFSDSPTFTTLINLPNTGLHILDTNASHDLILAPGSDITADRTLTFTTGDADRTVTLNGNPTLNDWFDQSVKSGTSPTFDGTNITGVSLDNVDEGITNYYVFNAHNGTFRESFDADVTSDGAIVTMSIEKTGTGDLTTQFSSGVLTYDTTPADTIVLTAGSDISPQGNWIYILQSAPTTLVKSTSSWPSAEHTRVGFFFVQSAGSVQTDGGTLINQNWNCELANTSNQGHIFHIAKKVRMMGSTYFSGIAGNGATASYYTISASNTEFLSTSGIVLQLHEQTFPAFSTPTDTIHVVNSSVSAFRAITDLFSITTDNTGATITNNKYFNLVLWGVANKTGEHQVVMCNVPGGFYNSQSEAENDVSGFDVFSIPREFAIDSSNGFLIARTTFQMGATWTHISTVDLRGTTPQSASGGAGGVATDFADNTFTIFDNTDNTKEMVFDVGTNITTGNTRTLTPLDKSYTIGDMVLASPGTLAGAWDMGSQNLTNVDIDSGTLDGITTLQMPSGDIGATGARIAKGWFIDLQVTNNIAGSITGNAATVSTIAGLAPDTATTQASQPNITSLGSLTGLVSTGVIDFGGATSSELANSATPTTNATGEIALDITITDHQPLWQYYDGAENMTVIAIDTAQLPATDNEIIKYDAATDKFVLEADADSGGAPEGTAVLSTGEVGGTKFLREDGDGTSSWQMAAGGGDVSKVGTPVDNQVGVWTGDGTIEGDPDFVWDSTSLTIGRAAVGSAQSVGSTLINSTDAAAGVQQFSPVFELEGQGWRTDSVAETQEVKWGIQTRPVQGTANPTSVFDFLSSINGGAYSAKATLTSDGVMTATTFVGALTGNSTTTTTASAGDAAVDFFGAGVDAVTDATTCTDIEGTLLLITAGTLNVVVNTADISDVSVTATEFAELQTMDSTTISANQWITLGGIAETLTSAELDLLDGVTSPTGSGALVLATSPTLVTPVLGVASSTSLATSAAIPLLLTNGQLVNIALTSQTVGATTLTIPDFASVVDEFTFKTKAQIMSNKTFVAPILGTPGSGNLTNCTAYEGTAILSTGEAGGSKFLREDGDNTSSWQTVTAAHDGTITWTGTSILETGVAFQFGDASDATITHTYANTGTNVSIAYSTAAMAITGVLTATNLSGTNTGDNTVATSGDSATAFFSSGILESSFGGTGNAFTLFSGPTTAERTFTLPDSSQTLAYAGGAFHDGFSDFLSTEHFLQSAITVTGALNTGSITSGFTSIDVGAGAIAGGSFDASEGNIANVGDVQLDSLTADDGTTITVNDIMDLIDNQIKQVELLDYSENVNTVAAAGATETLDMTVANVHDITLDENITFTFSNPSASGKACSFTLIKRQDDPGGNSTTWPASVDWAGGSAPTEDSIGTNSTYIYSFMTVDAGTIWHGFLGSADSK